MILINRVRILIVLLFFLFVDKAFAIYRLADRRPRNAGSFFESIFISELNFFSIDNVQLWVFILTGLAMFIVIYLAARRVHIFKYNDNAALVFAVLVSIITLLASPVSTWISTLGIIGPILVALVFLIGVIMLVNDLFLFGFGINVKLKNPRNRARFYKLDKFDRWLINLIKRIKKLPHPDEADYEHLAKELTSDIREMLHNLARLNRIFRGISRKSGNKRVIKKVAKLFRKIKWLLDDAESKLNKKNARGAISSLNKAYRLFLKLKRIIAKLLKDLEKRGKEEPSTPEEPGEDEPGDSEPGDEEPPEEPSDKEWLGYKFGVGEIYGYKTNKGEETAVEVANLFPERNAIQVKDVRGGPLFVVRPQMLYEVDEGSIKVIENLKVEYIRIKEEADKLPEMDPRRVELEKDGLKIYDKLRKLGVEFTS